MTIFIYEDDLLQAQALRETVQKLCADQFMTYEAIVVTSKERELLQAIPTCQRTPLYLLDLEIKGQERQGLEIAQAIRQIDPFGVIVFITTHVELAPISYTYMVSAFTFIDKAAPAIHKEHLLNAALKEYVARNVRALPQRYFIVDNDFTSIKVPFEQVEYVMTDAPHRLQLVTTTQFIQFYGTLKEIEEMDDALVRCHKSYIVHTAHIASLDRKQCILHLQSGKQIPVSRRLIKVMQPYIKAESI